MKNLQMFEELVLFTFVFTFYFGCIGCNDEHKVVCRSKQSIRFEGVHWLMLHLCYVDQVIVNAANLITNIDPSDIEEVKLWGCFGFGSGFALYRFVPDDIVCLFAAVIWFCFVWFWHRKLCIVNAN